METSGLYVASLHLTGGNVEVSQYAAMTSGLAALGAREKIMFSLFVFFYIT
jgi:hypothetical protein